MKAKSEVVWCNRGWFPFYYGFCPTKAVWNAEMKRLVIKNPPDYPTSDGCCNTFENSAKDLLIIVTINNALDKKNDPNAIVGLLVHEAVHVWQKLCDCIGESNPSPEFEAYVVQFVTSELLIAYSKTRKPKFK